MPARPSGLRSRLGFALVALAACQRDEAPAPVGSAPAAVSAPAPAPAPKVAPPGVAAAIRLLDAAVASLATWNGCEAGAGYGSVRRALAALEPFARTGARRASEVLYGPPRAADEGAGAVGAIDTALADHACEGVRAQRFQIESALLLARHEIEDDRRLADARAAQLVSDAAYELGLALLAARTSSSRFDEADRGEALGLADAVEAGATALFPAPPDDLAHALDELRALRATVERAPLLTAVPDRARLARATGGIGLAVRRAATARGLSVRGPHHAPAGTPDAAVSPLSLPPPRRPLDPEQVALGARLFSDVRLSANNRRSCASCHDPARAYTEPRATPTSLDPSITLRRNTPTLLYDGLHATQLWDGRIVTAETQALRVVHNRAELGLDDGELVARVKADPAYAAAFAMQKPSGVTAASIGVALGAYVASLGSGTAPIDAYARGDDAALSPEARRGLDVFVGQGRCSRCHVPPLWGGSRPTDFAVSIYSVLGVPASADGRTRDDDPGRFDVTHRELDRGAFKTPTVRNIARTAPYMHHGRYATLEQVVDFYDRGGGRGLGLTIPNQDPDVLPLRLSPADRKALLVFLREGLLDAR
ncbi:Cytochrome c551 peroxidase [Minicystis rosea]|nr:Cytochrome c551 peroxidase [Minicystis rosea]